MIDRTTRRLWDRLGRRYGLVFVAVQIPVSILIALGIVGVIVSYYPASTGETALIAGTTSAFTALGVAAAILRQRTALLAIADWRSTPTPSDEATIAAWDAATNFSMRSFRRNSVITNATAALPSVALMVAILDLPVAAFPVVLAAGAVAAAYGTIVTYSTSELLMRPAVQDIAAALPESFTFVRNGLPLRKRLMISLPVFAAITGLFVTALVTDREGTEALAMSVLASLGVGLALSWELGVLLARSITSPIRQLREAMTGVREGDYEVRVPVVSSDDLGDLSDSFNRMAEGLEERERMREAFGTYLDRDVARFILSGRFPDEGVEVDVSILFCDVPRFTSFAEQASAREVVSSLNALFGVLVPIVDRHGGHVDKFLGDGLLAVFGAPENFPDHADRALAAGLEMVAATDGDSGGLGVCVGINSGRVVVGSIGGAGRLNFSVIGDAVNVAARVEAATRETGDDLLLTCETRDALVRPAELVSRGSVPLKGKAEPLELLAPTAEGATRGRAAVSASGRGGRAR